MLRLRNLVRRLRPAPQAATHSTTPQVPITETRGQWYAPNGKKIVASADLVPGNALIAAVTQRSDGTIEIDWDGETRMAWDGQFTDEIDGRRIFLDEAGNEWREDQLVVKPDEPES